MDANRKPLPADWAAMLAERLRTLATAADSPSEAIDAYLWTHAYVEGDAQREGGRHNRQSERRSPLLASFRIVHISNLFLSVYSVLQDRQSRTPATRELKMKLVEWLQALLVRPSVGDENESTYMRQYWSIQL